MADDAFIATTMPIYEYHCKACGEDFEVLVTGQTTPVCPHCQSPKLTKLLSTFAAHGTGERGSARASQPAAHSHPAGCGCCRAGTGSCGLN